MNLSLSGKVGLRAIIYYMVTTLLAVILGVILVTSIKPGESVDSSDHVEPTGLKKKNVTTVDTMLDLIRNCLPPNIVQATMQQYRTHLIYPEVDNVRLSSRQVKKSQLINSIASEDGQQNRCSHQARRQVHLGFRATLGGAFLQYCKSSFVVSLFFFSSNTFLARPGGVQHCYRYRYRYLW